jgi:hypothetical protein
MSHWCQHLAIIFLKKITSVSENEEKLRFSYISEIRNYVPLKQFAGSSIS